MTIKPLQRLSAVLSAEMQEAGKLMITEGGKATNAGSTTLTVKTQHGLWTLAFMPGPGVDDAVKALQGKQVQCIYQEK